MKTDFPAELHIFDDRLFDVQVLSTPDIEVYKMAIKLEHEGLNTGVRKL